MVNKTGINAIIKLQALHDKVTKEKLFLANKEGAELQVNIVYTESEIVRDKTMASRGTVGSWGREKLQF